MWTDNFWWKDSGKLVIAVMSDYSIERGVLDIVDEVFDGEKEYPVFSILSRDGKNVLNMNEVENVILDEEL